MLPKQWAHCRLDHVSRPPAKARPTTAPQIAGALFFPHGFNQQPTNTQHHVVAQTGTRTPPRGKTPELTATFTGSTKNRQTLHITRMGQSMATLEAVAGSLKYTDLRRRLLSAYQWDSAGDNPNTHADPWLERKLAYKLATYDEPAFIHLMHNIVADTCLSSQGAQDLTEYAIRLRSWASADQPLDAA